MKVSWNKKMRAKYSENIAKDKAETESTKPFNLAEEIVTAKRGNEETLRQMAENAGDVEKVIELKKDYTRTTAYIKALEEANKLRLKETPMAAPVIDIGHFAKARADGGKNIFQKDSKGLESEFYYVQPKQTRVRKLFCERNIFIFAGLFFPMVAQENGKPINWALWFGCYGFELFILAIYFATLKWLNWLANDKKRQRKEYEKEKRFVAIVRANGMFVPHFGTKESYRQALNFVEAYEKAYPEEYEPYRLWLTQEEWGYYSTQALNAKRKPLV
jgi:hypothetical protein